MNTRWVNSNANVLENGGGWIYHLIALFEVAGVRKDTIVTFTADVFNNVSNLPQLLGLASLLQFSKLGSIDEFTGDFGRS